MLELSTRFSNTFVTKNASLELVEQLKERQNTEKCGRLSKQKNISHTSTQDKFITYFAYLT